MSGGRAVELEDANVSGQARGQTGRAAARLDLVMLGMESVAEQPAGLNRYFGELMSALESHGVRPRAVLVGMRTTSEGAVRVIPLTDALPQRLWRYGKAASDAARGGQVIDAHFALYAGAGLVHRSVRRLPLVVHFQGPWAAESQAAGGGGLAASVKRRIEKFVYRRAREVVVLSSAFKRILIEDYGVLPWRVHVLPPGIDIERFRDEGRADARAALGIRAGTRVVLTVRRLIPRTGVGVLVRAWEHLADVADTELVVAGDGPERGALESLARTLGLERRVRFLGRVDDEKLALWYRAADVAVVPSLALEGYGLVVLEALASGTPVIGTDAGGLPEALTGLAADCVVPAGDANRLAERIRAALDGSAPLPSRAACRSHAERFSWSRVAAEHVRIYELACGSRSERPLRVVYLDHCARLSGAEIALLRLLPVLPGVEPHVILGEDGPLVARLLNAGISVEVIPFARSARDVRRESVRARRIPISAAVSSGVYAARLGARLRRLRPDLVHTNSLKAALYGGVAGKLAGVPVIWHARDRIAEDYLPRSAVRLVRTAAKTLPAGVIAVSDATLATLPGETHGPACMIRDPVSLAELPARRDGEPLRVGLVGRIAPWKGQHIFLDAFARAFPHGRERAVLVGAPLFGETEYERGLHELAKRLGLAERCEFRGFRDDVVSELARLDVLVHASVIPEPGGQVVVEGLAAGMPVVASAAGGPAEIIADGVNGLLCPPGDADALADALRQLAADPRLRERLGTTAQSTATRFEPTEIGRQVVDLYRRVLASPSEAQ